MTLYEFNVLTLEEKQTIVWEKGTFLDNHISENEKCNCYEIIDSKALSFDWNGAFTIEHTCILENKIKKETKN